jgi:hypothetical protein
MGWESEVGARFRVDLPPRAVPIRNHHRAHFDRAGQGPKMDPADSASIG